MEKSSSHIIYDGKLISADEPALPVHSRGLMYGDGIFETFRTYSGKTLFLERHLQRLAEGLEVLGIRLPDELNKDNFKPLIVELLREKGLLNDDAIVRLQVWRDGHRGYSPQASANSHFSIMASKCPPFFKSPALATVDIKRIPSKSLPSAYKFSNGINFILAAREADRKGVDEALMQTIEGKISETTIANIFWIKDDVIFTPSVKCDIIPGITRQILIDLSDQNTGCKLYEGEYSLSHILEADAALMTNSVREILPVKALNDHFFETEGNIIKQFESLFSKFRDQHLKAL